MMSRSYTNLLDLAAGNFAAALGQSDGGRRRSGSFGAKRMPRVMTVPGTLSELDDEDDADDDAAGTGSVAQAKDLLDHLDNVLTNEKVSVKSGQFIVEVKPQGVSKGLVAEKILTLMKEKGRQADFVLCIGDDRSDEDMFENITAVMKRNIVAPKSPLFACTVGQKPSKARFYLDDTYEVVTTLSALADASEPGHVEELDDNLATSVSSIDISHESLHLENRRPEES